MVNVPKNLSAFDKFWFIVFLVVIALLADVSCIAQSQKFTWHLSAYSGLNQSKFVLNESIITSGYQNFETGSKLGANGELSLQTKRHFKSSSIILNIGLAQFQSVSKIHSKLPTVDVKQQYFTNHTYLNLGTAYGYGFSRFSIGLGISYLYPLRGVSIEEYDVYNFQKNERRNFTYRNTINTIELANFVLSFPVNYHLNNRFSLSLEYLHGLTDIPNQTQMGKMYYRMINFGVVLNFGAVSKKTE